MADTFQGLAPALFNRPAVKTASYSLDPNLDAGGIFIANGSGALTFTLPPVAAVPNGWWGLFLNAVDQNMVISAPSGKLITLNNAAATTGTFSTLNQKIGAAMYVWYESTIGKYVGVNISAGCTLTVA